MMIQFNSELVECRVDDDVERGNKKQKLLLLGLDLTSRQNERETATSVISHHHEHKYAVTSPPTQFVFWRKPKVYYFSFSFALAQSPYLLSRSSSLCWACAHIHASYHGEGEVWWGEDVAVAGCRCILLVLRTWLDYKLMLDLNCSHRSLFSNLERPQSSSHPRIVWIVFLK